MSKACIRQPPSRKQANCLFVVSQDTYVLGLVLQLISFVTLDKLTLIPWAWWTLKFYVKCFL